MDKLKEIKKNLDEVIEMATVAANANSWSEKTSSLLLYKLSCIGASIIELQKIQNYTDASVPVKEDSPKRENPSREMVNHPSHYKGNKYEAIEVMLDVFGKEKVSAFCELNAFKYQWRANNKGTNIQDKEKAIWYNKKYIELNKE